ncbi:hypothetical protein FQR65_LT07015 [Abscondita terminalis]|nr:hypothetical protein FQR65_LT07015 [Abscondita terminalis]
MIVFNIFSVLVFSLLFSFDLYICKFNQSEQTLQLLITVFRHGDRTNDVLTNYPKNPYINETYYPYGYGELTNLGKEKMYKLGEEFKNMYYLFLEQQDLFESIDLLSTNLNRTRCSLEFFLKGLFFTYNSTLDCENFTPFSYKVVALENNRILSMPLWYCPKYQLLYDIYISSREGRSMERYYKPLYSYISQRTGLTIDSTYDLMLLYMQFICEKDWGFALPEWTKLVYPEYLTNAIKTYYKTTVASSAHNQLFGVSLLSGLNIYFPHIPNYGACVVLELHKVNQTYYIKVLYNQEIFNKFVEMQIPGCPIMCPFEKFVNLVHSNLPEDGDPCIIDDLNEITK